MRNDSLQSRMARARREYVEDVVGYMSSCGRGTFDITSERSGLSFDLLFRPSGQLRLDGTSAQFEPFTAKLVLGKKLTLETFSMSGRILGVKMFSTGAPKKAVSAIMAWLESQHHL